MQIYDYDYRKHPFSVVECPFCQKNDTKMSLCFYCKGTGEVETSKIQWDQDYWLKTQQISQNMQHLPFEQFREQYFSKINETNQ